MYVVILTLKMNDMNENDMKRSGSVVADVCNANIEIDANRSRGM